jgi:hypothetical protein
LSVAVDQRGSKSAAVRLRCNRTLGFLIGGLVLAIVGCFVGAAFPYHHPVAVATSMTWWGIFFGTFGACIGALLGILAESTAAAPVPASNVEPLRQAVHAVSSTQGLESQEAVKQIVLVGRIVGGGLEKPFPNFRDLERIHGVTWGDLVAMEPRLEELLWEAHQKGATCRHGSHVDRAFSPLRNTLTELVGFACKCPGHPVLGSPAAYDIAYWKLYDAVAALIPNGAARTEEIGQELRAGTRQAADRPMPARAGKVSAIVALESARPFTAA